MRNWKFYSKEKLINKLNWQNWDIKFDDVQHFWNTFKGIVIEIVDELCPLVKANKLLKLNNDPSKYIKQKLKRGNNLRRKIKTHPHNSISARTEVKTPNKEIKKGKRNSN